MRLKVIFLGYLRELTQMDQTFSKQLLDPEPINQDILNKYVTKINKAMNSALKALRWEEYLGIEETDETLDELENNSLNVENNLSNIENKHSNTQHIFEFETSDL